ncbi:type 4b pilus protein PilO2 [Cupriavidus sp. AU9028]|uniref:type 4b pilus protein PilO2 n=1 Tax=Cupriavidus sp. AU9028 TaxID=2871157 RepID=UPI001C967B0B|nr:type 4b pilus protein PilO2 [Cupriavidus sp. AU9028]MBY4898653.1 type 4b pilus protein PilO2 [Cupriavidus sp. AU9028]
MAEILYFPGMKGGFALGLIWQHEETPPSLRSLRVSAAELGRSFRWSVVHQSPAGAIQSGFCEPLHGIRPASLRALAAEVASHHRAPWNGIFHLEGDRYWYIAVRQGHAIIPGGDRIGTIKDLTSLRERHRALGEWLEVDGTLQDLASIVRTTKSTTALRDVQSGPWKAAAYAGVAVASLAVVAGGAWYWYDQQQTAEREALAARQRAFAAAQLASEAARRESRPWAAEAVPSEFLNACRREWNGQALAHSGWPLASWRCRAVSQTAIAIDVTWHRSGGVALDAPGALSEDGNRAASTRDTATSFAPSGPDILAVSDARRALWTYAQRVGVALQVAMPPPLLPSDNGAPVDPWLLMTAEIPFGAPPWLGPGHGLDTVPALRLTEIGYDAATAVWNGKAKIYALRHGLPQATQRDVNVGGGK